MIMKEKLKCFSSLKQIRDRFNVNIRLVVEHLNELKHKVNVREIDVNKKKQFPNPNLTLLSSYTQHGAMDLVDRLLQFSP